MATAIQKAILSFVLLVCAAISSSVYAEPTKFSFWINDKKMGIPLFHSDIKKIQVGNFCGKPFTKKYNKGRTIKFYPQHKPQDSRIDIAFEGKRGLAHFTGKGQPFCLWHPSMGKAEVMITKQHVLAGGTQIILKPSPTHSKSKKQGKGCTTDRYWKIQDMCANKCDANGKTYHSGSRIWKCMSACERRNNCSKIDS
jgi:hypothetical protein